MANKNNCGAIFKNNNKNTDKQPDYRGSVTVDNKDYEIALWLRKSEKGTSYFSVALSEPYKKEDKTPIAPQPALPKPTNNEYTEQDGDLPF